MVKSREGILEGGETLSAASVAVTGVMRWVPSARDNSSLPSPPTVRKPVRPVALVAAWPRKVVPLSMICTLLNGSAVPVKVGVVALVLPGARVGVGGTAGAVIS